MVTGLHLRAQAIVGFAELCMLMTGQQTGWYADTNTDLLLVAGCREEQLVHVCMGVDRIIVCNTHTCMYAIRHQILDS